MGDLCGLRCHCHNPGSRVLVLRRGVGGSTGRNRSEGPARSIEKRKELALSRSALREFTLSLSPVLAQPSLSSLANLCYCIPCSALLAVISRREVLLHERQPHLLPICVPSVNHQPVMNQETLINH